MSWIYVKIIAPPRPLHKPTDLPTFFGVLKWSDKP